MNSTQESIAILDSINDVNSAIAELVGSSSKESRRVLIEWIKADMALMEEVRAGVTARLEALAPPNTQGEQCSDTVLSALDSAIAAKCLAIAALQEECRVEYRRAVN
jgi:hypothetical protein